MAVLSFAPGCGKHNRSSLRPIYVGPPAATVVTPSACPAGSNCGAVTGRPCPAGADCTAGSAAPAASAGFDNGETLVSPPAATRAPSSSTGGEPQLDPDALKPAGSSATRRATPTSDEKAKPASNDEILIDPQPKSSGDEPSLEAPRGARLTPASGVRMADLQMQLREYANDPDDLLMPPKADRSWKYVVIHHSAHATGSYAQIDRDHRSRLGTAGCGYHFVIGNGSESPDGQIEVSQRWSDQKAGAHCRDSQDPAVNDYGIGICLVGDLDNGEPTPRQIEATKLLVKYLEARYRIPVQNVGTHAQLAHSATACPGKNFPVAAVLGVNGRKMAAR